MLPGLLEHPPCAPLSLCLLQWVGDHTHREQAAAPGAGWGVTVLGLLLPMLETGWELGLGTEGLT